MSRRDGGPAQSDRDLGTLRARHRRRVLRADLRTSPYVIRWEVLRPFGGAKEPAALTAFRVAARSAAPAVREAFVDGVGAPISLGLRSVQRAIEVGDAQAVVVCSEGIPSALVQHLPVMCALRGIPIAIIAASPRLLAEVVAPCVSTRPCKSQEVVAVALLRGCAAYPPLAQLCQQTLAAAPIPKTPFLIPSAGLPQRPGRCRSKRAEPLRVEEPSSKSPQMAVARPDASDPNVAPIAPSAPTSLLDASTPACSSTLRTNGTNIEIQLPGSNGEGQQMPDAETPSAGILKRANKRPCSKLPGASLQEPPPKQPWGSLRSLLGGAAGSSTNVASPAPTSCIEAGTPIETQAACTDVSKSSRKRNRRRALQSSDAQTDSSKGRGTTAATGDIGNCGAVSPAKDASLVTGSAATFGAVVGESKKAACADQDVAQSISDDATSRNIYDFFSGIVT